MTKNITEKKHAMLEKTAAQIPPFNLTATFEDLQAQREAHLVFLREMEAVRLNLISNDPLFRLEDVVRAESEQLREEILKRRRAK